MIYLADKYGMVEVIQLYTDREAIIRYLSRRLVSLVAEVAAVFEVDREFAYRFGDGFREGLDKVFPAELTIQKAETIFRRFQPYWRRGIVEGLEACAQRRR